MILKDRITKIRNFKPIRQGRFEFRYSDCNSQFEIVEYSPNGYYNKYSEYTFDEESGWFRLNENKHCCVSPELLSSKELCTQICSFKPTFDKLIEDCTEMDDVDMNMSYCCVLKLASVLEACDTDFAYVLRTGIEELENLLEIEE